MTVVSLHAPGLTSDELRWLLAMQRDDNEAEKIAKHIQPPYAAYFDVWAVQDMVCDAIEARLGANWQQQLVALKWDVRTQLPVLRCVAESSYNEHPEDTRSTIAYYETLSDEDAATVAFLIELNNYLYPYANERMIKAWIKSPDFDEFVRWDVDDE